MMEAAAVTSMPGIEHRRLNAASCFTISSEIASSTVWRCRSRDSKCSNIIRRKDRWCSESEPFKATRISSMRFRVCVFRHLSRASREISPYSMRWRIIFRPEAPNASDRNAVKRKPELCRNLSMRFFWAVMSWTMLLRYRVRCRSSRKVLSGIKLPFSNPARSNVAIHCASRISVLRPGTFFMWRAFTTRMLIWPSKQGSNIS